MSTAAEFHRLEDWSSETLPLPDLLQHLPVRVLACSPDGSQVYLNGAWNAGDPGALENLKSQWASALSQREGSVNGDPDSWQAGFEWHEAGQRTRWHRLRACAVRGSEGELVGWVGLFEEPSSEVLRLVSHALRSPLNTIRGWTHVLRRLGPPTPEQLRALDAIDRGVAAQARLIDHLLHPPASLATPTGAGPSPRDLDAGLPDAILVVDDDADVRELLQQLLGEDNWLVLPFENAAAAFAYLRDAQPQRRPKLLISDIAMPDEDGCSFIRRVRALQADRGESRLPAVALTGMPDARTMVMSAGFDAHVAKPFDPDALSALLSEMREGIRFASPASSVS